MFKDFLLALAVIFFACTPLTFAQQPEFPKPGPEHEKLQAFVGEWDAVMEMEGQKSKCTATYKSICGGMWVVSDFKGELAPGIAFTGHGIDGYELHEKKYVGIWVDSMGSNLNMKGNLDSTGKLVMVGESYNMEGKKEKFKATTELKDKDHFTFKMFMIEGDKENLAFTIEYTRKK